MSGTRHVLALPKPLRLSDFALAWRQRFHKANGGYRPKEGNCLPAGSLSEVAVWRVLAGLFIGPILTTYLALTVLYSRNPRRRRDAKDLLRLLLHREPTEPQPPEIRDGGRGLLAINYTSAAATSSRRTPREALTSITSPAVT